MMMMKSVFWWRKPEYPEETTDLRQVTDGFHFVDLQILDWICPQAFSSVWNMPGLWKRCFTLYRRNCFNAELKEVAHQIEKSNTMTAMTVPSFTFTLRSLDGHWHLQGQGHLKGQKLSVNYKNWIVYHHCVNLCHIN